MNIQQRLQNAYKRKELQEQYHKVAGGKMGWHDDVQACGLCSLE